MEGTERTLVIILSGALAVFLVLGIVALVKVIQILDALKRITAKAEHIADKAESISEVLRKSAGPLAIGRLMAHLSEVVFNRHAKKKRRNEDG